MPESGFATLENGQLPPLDRQIGTAGSSGFLLGLRSTIRWESEQSESNKCSSAGTDSPESKRHPSYIGGTTTLHDTTKERADSEYDEITVNLFPYCTENQFPYKRGTCSEPNKIRRIMPKAGTRPQLGTKTAARKLRIFSFGDGRSQ